MHEYLHGHEEYLHVVNRFRGKCYLFLMLQLLFQLLVTHYIELVRHLKHVFRLQTHCFLDYGVYQVLLIAKHRRPLHELLVLLQEVVLETIVHK